MSTRQEKKPRNNKMVNILITNVVKSLRSFSNAWQKLTKLLKIVYSNAWKSYQLQKHFTRAYLLQNLEVLDILKRTLGEANNACRKPTTSFQKTWEREEVDKKPRWKVATFVLQNTIVPIDCAFCFVAHFQKCKNTVA